jgi:hypothetical protein
MLQAMTFYCARLQSIKRELFEISVAAAAAIAAACS